MARILFTWELGGGMGHVAPYLPLIEGLRERGHEVGFALRNLQFAELSLGSRGIPFFQAPAMQGRFADNINEPYTFAQILHNVGYADVDLITALARAWRELYRCFKPDLIVCDHSPTALLAARDFPVRKAVVGPGFFLPPDTGLPPVLRKSAPAPAQEFLLQEEQRIVGNINRVLGVLHATPIERIAQMYAADAQILLTLRELDHYLERQADTQVEYWGIGRSGMGEAPQWPALEGKRIYAYLKPFKTLPSLLERLVQLGQPTLIYAPEVEAGLKLRFASRAVQFCASPLDLERTAQECDLAITNATHATALTFLLAGKPQLMLPLYLEQRLVGDNVERLGAGLNAPALHPVGMSSKLDALLTDPRYTQGAQSFAARYAGFDPDEMEQRLIQRIDALAVNHA